jgi:8-oxo-dGTP diphosphatase
MPVIRYCYNCAAAVTDHGPGTHPHCESCGETTWRNSKPTASVLITDARGRVLLVQRAVEPMLGYWDIPGGFLEPGELPEPGALREAREELGVELELTGLLGVYSGTYRDDTEFTLNLVYTAEIVSGTPQAADDALELGWFGPSELPIEIAFGFIRDALWDWRKARSRG